MASPYSSGERDVKGLFGLHFWLDALRKLLDLPEGRFVPGYPCPRMVQHRHRTRRKRLSGLTMRTCSYPGAKLKAGKTKTLSGASPLKMHLRSHFPLSSCPCHSCVGVTRRRACRGKSASRSLRLSWPKGNFAGASVEKRRPHGTCQKVGREPAIGHWSVFGLKGTSWRF